MSLIYLVSAKITFKNGKSTILKGGGTFRPRGTKDRYCQDLIAVEIHYHNIMSISPGKIKEEKNQKPVALGQEDPYDKFVSL